MHSRTILVAVALSTIALAAPVPNDNIWGANPSTSTSSAESSVESILGSPFANGNNDGSGNSVGSGNAGNGNSKFILHVHVTFCSYNTRERKWRWK
jgi:hypothetical protein